MNFRLVFRVTGKTLMVLAVSMLLPLLVCLLYQEDPLPFLLAIAITGAAGFLLSLIRSNDHFFPREGFFAVALIWLLVAYAGRFPFTSADFLKATSTAFSSRSPALPPPAPPS